ncbi:MAG: bacteriohemerythrin [bacterium]
MTTKKLEWEERYSVGVKLIDDQHKHLFAIINELLEAINTNTSKEKLKNIFNGLVEYKKFHFQTEEKYFKDFNYSGATEHIKEHEKFNASLTALKEKYPEDTTEVAFMLIDFLEDWLIDHIMNADQKYKACFISQKLK